MAGAALLFRAGYLLFFRNTAFFDAPILDSAFHDGMARSLAGGDLSAGAPYFRPPLFPWLLGGLYAAFGAGPWPGRILNLVAGVATTLAVYGCSRRLSLGRGARLAASGIVAVFAPDIFLCGELLGEPVATALGAWGLWALLGTVGGPGTSGSPGFPAQLPQAGARSIWPWLLTSLLWSASALARGSQGILPILLMVHAGLGRARWPRLAAVVVGMALVWSGPAAIMASKGAGFRFPATQAGINLYIGNHPGADGRSVRVPELEGASGWVEFAAASVRVASRARGRPLTPPEASDYWTRRALEFWAHDPAAALGLTAARGLFLVHGFEGPNNRSLYEARRDVPWLGALLVKLPGAYWPSGLLFPLALVGILAVARVPRWRPVLLYTAGSLLPLLVFFVCARFRLPALPALALLAVAGSAAILRAPRRWGVIFLGFYLLSNLPWSPAIAESPLGEALARGEAALNAGNYEIAAAAYGRALETDPESGRAWLGLAVVAENRGDPAGAATLLARAEQRLPRYWAVQEALGRLAIAQGDLEGAARHYRLAREDFPENPRLAGSLGLLLELQGRHTEARDQLELAIAGGAGTAEIWNSLGRYRRLSGDPRGALEAWNHALEIDPEGFKPRFNRGLARLEGGDRAGAVEDLRRALVLAPDAESAARIRELMSRIGKALP